MKLHYFKGTVAVAVAITLHEAGLDFEAVNVDFQNADRTRAPYLAINPKGRVPALPLEQPNLLPNLDTLVRW